jgi:hypothetical protein
MAFSRVAHAAAAEVECDEGRIVPIFKQHVCDIARNFG